MYSAANSLKYFTNYNFTTFAAEARFFRYLHLKQIWAWFGIIKFFSDLCDFSRAKLLKRFTNVSDLWSSLTCSSKHPLATNVPLATSFGDQTQKFVAFSLGFGLIWLPPFVLHEAKAPQAEISSGLWRRLVRSDRTLGSMQISTLRKLHFFCKRKGFRVITWTTMLTQQVGASLKSGGFSKQQRMTMKIMCSTYLRQFLSSSYFHVMFREGIKRQLWRTSEPCKKTSHETICKCFLCHPPPKPTSNGLFITEENKTNFRLKMNPLKQDFIKTNKLH